MQVTLEGGGTPCPWLAASVPLWPLGENEFHPWQTTEPHCLGCSLPGKGRGPCLFSRCGLGRRKGGGLEGRCIFEGPQEPCANVCLPCSSLHTQPVFCSYSVPLSLVCLSPHFVPSWPGKPGTISTWAPSSLQLPPAAQTPSGSWLMAFLLMLAQPMSTSLPPTLLLQAERPPVLTALCSPFPQTLTVMVLSWGQVGCLRALWREDSESDPDGETWQHVRGLAEGGLE